MNVITRKIVLGHKSLRCVKMHAAAVHTTKSTEDAYYVDLTAERRFKVFHHLPESPSKCKPVGIVYVPGFRSTSQGNKARRLLDHCREKPYELVRYDPEGLGESPHDPQQLEFPHWVENAESAMSRIRSDRLVLVGSSLGGLISIKLALKHPDRVSALFLFCPAVGMTSKIRQTWQETLGKESLEEVDSGEVFWFKDDGMPPLSFTKKLLDTQAREGVELTSPLNIQCPIVVMHGMQDDVVPHEISVALAKSVRTPKVDLVLRKDGDHRLSREEDLQLMTDCLDRLIGSL